MCIFPENSAQSKNYIKDLGTYSSFIFQYLISTEMNSFDTEFITELFLDCDSITTVNRVVVTVANVINENNENVNAFNEVIRKDLDSVLQSEDEHPVATNGYNSKIRNNSVLKTFSDEDYITNFKVKKSTVEALVTFLQENVNPDNDSVPLLKKVHIFLYLLTSDLSYSEVGSIFGLQKSTVSYIFHRLAKMLCEQRFRFINWPSLEEQHVTSMKVNSRFQFPNCVGFIDACRFKVGSRRSRKFKQDTILLQAVCDDSLMFIDVHIGTLGTTRKTKVFKESQLSKELRNFVEFDNHILGDSGYKLKNNLLTPFSSEELLTSEEMKFNEVHWKTRSYIGHAFELLKERFRRLSHLDVNKAEAVNTILIAACVLHNFILLHEGCPDIKEEIVASEDAVNIDTSIVKTSDEKRQFICNYINFMNADSASLEGT